MDIFIKPVIQRKMPVELKGLDKVMSLSELQNTVLSLLSGPDKDLAQDVFDEILTSDTLSRKVDSNLERALFERVLELAAQRYGVPNERLDRFLLRVSPLWKMR